MDKRTLLATLLAAVAVASGGRAWVERGRAARQQALAEFDARRLTLVQSENDRLRALVQGYEKAGHAAARATQRAEIERATARIRGLAFARPIVYDVLTREGIKRVLQQKLAEQYSDAEFESARLAYVALGLIPADYPLKQRYIDLLGEQVAAFYDQHAHRLFMFEDASLDSLQNRVILSHELTHALQDQHFGLRNLALEIKDNDDRALAASALVEGDATLEMNGYMAENLSLKGIGEDVAGLFTQSLDQLQAAPRILRESLLFPYTSGLAFCMAIQKKPGDFTAISAVFQRPPASSAQILHPEKYLANEQPIPVVWPDLTALGEPPVADNVLGELGTRILLSDWTDEATAPAVAQGWRGDRYLVFDHGKAFVWRTVWDTPQDAARFLEAAKKMFARRYGSNPARKLKLLPLPPAGALIVDAPDDRWLEALSGKFAR